MTRRIRNIAIAVAIVFAGIWLLRKMNVIPSLHNIFSSKPVTIDKTPILVKEIKAIGQLITMTAYDEVVVDSISISKASSVIHTFNSVSPFPVIPVVDPKLVLIGKGKVLAGVDLKNMSKDRIIITNDTLTCKLPKAVILDVIVNPSDFETFIEQGRWSAEAVAAVKMKARQKMIDRALQKNILAMADEKARNVMKDFFEGGGFKEVIVTSE